MNTLISKQEIIHVVLFVTGLVMVNYSLFVIYVPYISALTLFW